MGTTDKYMGVIGVIPFSKVVFLRSTAGEVFKGTVKGAGAVHDSGVLKDVGLDYD